MTMVQEYPDCTLNIGIQTAAYSILYPGVEFRLYPRVLGISPEPVMSKHQDTSRIQ